ncbi:MAG: response regulator [Eubacteriales bacterium]
MSKILLVDDESIERKVLKSFIQDEFPEIIQIDEAENGIIAIDMFDKTPYDIVIMDIKMPGMNGIDATKVLKLKKPDTVVIFLTAYIDPSKIYQSFTSGGQEFLQKPVRKREFLDILMKYLPKKDDSLLILKNALNDSIIKNNLVTAKRNLNAITVNIASKNKDGSIIAIKEDYKDVAESIAKTVFDINKKFLGIKPEFQRIIEKASPISDQYLLKCWLFDALDFAFEIIVSEKNETLQYDEITKVLNYIEKNFKNRITLEEAAEHVNMSPYYLSKQFKKNIGINFIDYVTDLKIKTAKELLGSTSKPIIDISIELSFNEPNYFTRVFRKVTGMTPVKYRELMKKEKQ